MSDQKNSDRRISVRSKPRTEEDLRAIARVIIELALKGEINLKDEQEHGPLEKSA